MVDFCCYFPYHVYIVIHVSANLFNYATATDLTSHKTCTFYINSMQMILLIIFFIVLKHLAFTFLRLSLIIINDIQSFSKFKILLEELVVMLCTCRSVHQ